MRLDAHALDEGLDAAAALGISGLGKDGLPVVRPTGYAQLGAAGPVPLEVGTETYQVEDTVHWIRGRHNWEFGAQAIRRHVDGTASEWTSRGTFLFTPDYTSQPGVEVSWMVTGVRHDAFANTNRIPTEVAKQGNERGHYLHPAAFNAPASMGLMSTGAGANETGSSLSDPPASKAVRLAARSEAPDSFTVAAGLSH